MFLAVYPVLLAQKLLTNDSVIKMTKMGFSQDVIVTTIDRSPQAFDTSADGLVALKSAGVTPQVISAVLAKTSTSSSPVQIAVASPPVPVQAAAAAPSAPPAPFELLEGTPVKLRLGRTISSADEKVGNQVDFDTLDEIAVNGGRHHS